MNILLPTLLIIAAVAWPLLLGLILSWPHRPSIALRLASWGALPALLIAILPLPGPLIEVPWLLLGSLWGLDPVSRPFLLLAGLLWGIAGWHASTSVPASRQAHFFSWFNLALAGNIGLILAQDMLNFYLFFTLMSLASYGLIIHTRTAEAWRAGSRYIILVVLGEAAIFAALLLAAAAAGTLSFEHARPVLGHSAWLDMILLTAWLGFGIKAGVLGLHVWLPLAHPVAPAPASAVLSGVMIKAGLLGWLRLLPLGETMLPAWGAFWIILGLTAAFYAVVIGLTQRNAKTLLAYSSISQMGILTATIGLGLLAPHAWPAILSILLIYVLHHGLAKGALFLGVGILHQSDVRSQKWVWMGLWLPALALAGAPFTSGMLVKTLLKQQTLQLPEYWAMSWQVLLPASAIATTLLLGRFLLMTAPRNPGRPPDNPVPIRWQWPWYILLASIAAFPLGMGWISPFHWTGRALLDSLLPVLAAALSVLYISRSQSRLQQTAKVLNTLHLPPGDMLTVYEQAVMYILAGCRRLGRDDLPRWLDASRQKFLALRTSLDWQKIGTKLETWLAWWPLALTGFILLGLILANASLR